MKSKNNPVTDEKKDFRVKMADGMQAELDEILKLRGMNRTEWLARVTRWFLDAPPTVQQGVLGQLPEDVDLAQIVLERMATEQAGEAVDVPWGKVVSVIRRALAQERRQSDESSPSKAVG